MDYFVRNQDGELRFDGAEKFWLAVRTGIVGEEDQIRLGNSSQWLPLSQVPGRPKRWWQINHWYVLTGILLLAAVTGAGLITYIFIVAMHGIWRVYVRRGGSRRPRFW